MTGGIRAEVEIDDPDACPIARITHEAGTAGYSVSKSVDAADPTRVTREFVADADASVSSVDAGVDVVPVFSYGEKQVYRFERPFDGGCPTDCVEHFDCPVFDVAAVDGRLSFTFHAPEIETLHDVLHALRDRYEGFSVHRLLQTEGSYAAHDVAFFDTEELTTRQRVVLATAFRMGFFDHPRTANAGAVADELGIATSTFTEHLLAAQRKILEALIVD